MTDPEQGSCKILSVLRAHQCCEQLLLLFPSAQNDMAPFSGDAWLRICAADSDSP